ncbi:glycosyltransferase family 4 protein [Synechococcus sp. MU1651]|uniref:MraY family glycosyltransferase n=1 Tax=Synechococcus sp. MU1651 TaxID=2508353 RepID=UPI0020275EF8|nr:glycosyltransferase family 4 protein [Synechococcus sp. MU1651]
MRNFFLDLPNIRSSHVIATPRGGGFVFVVISFISSVFCLLSADDSVFVRLPLICFPLAVAGFIDDRYSLSALLRFLVQVFTAFCLVLQSPFVQNIHFSDPVGLCLFLGVFLFLLVASISIINFTNFMDGMDGLVAGCMIVAITCASILVDVSSPIWILVGSLVGFLFLNWSPAMVFMGDVGSTFLGAIFIGIVLQCHSWFHFFTSLLVATPLFADSFFCLLRRFNARQPIFQAHRLHLFQRLHQAGWSHQSVSFSYIAASLFLALALLFGGLLFILPLSVLVILYGFWLDRFVATPFLR